jgi:hypothetical protein
MVSAGISLNPGEKLSLPALLLQEENKTRQTVKRNAEDVLINLDFYGLNTVFP